MLWWRVNLDNMATIILMSLSVILIIGLTISNIKHNRKND